MRDHATLEQLLVLANLENMNAKRSDVFVSVYALGAVTGAVCAFRDSNSSTVPLLGVKAGGDLPTRTSATEPSRALDPNDSVHSSVHEDWRP